MNKKIMIVEDDKVIAKELYNLLENSNYSAVILNDFENAKGEILKSAADLILLGINIPSEDTEKDFSINEVDLKEVIRNVSIKNKDDLLENRVEFEVDVKKAHVNTDKKWLEFILNQIINNSIKYKAEKNFVEL